MTRLKQIRLGKAATVLSGYAFKSEHFVSEGVPVIKIGNITNGAVTFESGNTEYLPEEVGQAINSKFRVSKGDILISLTGSHMTHPDSVVGRVAQYKETFISLLNQRAGKVVITDEEELDNGYLYYVLSTASARQEIALLAHGAANQANVSPRDIEKLRLNILHRHEQTKIAAILSAYDELIENNKRRIALLEKLAEEIYREWFVRFRFPGHAHVKVVKRVPIGWSFEKASKFFGLVKGKSYAANEITDDPQDMPFISLKSFNRGGGYRADGLKYYSGRFRDEQVVRQDDVVVALTDMTQDRAVVGRPARIPSLGGRCAVISLDAVKLVPHNVNGTFLYAYMKHSGFSDFIKEFANGANVLHLKPELITNQRIVVPHRELQGEFALKVHPLYAQMDLFSEAITCLNVLRDILLPRLISGKLSVESLDIQFPDGITEQLKAESPTIGHA